MCTGDLLLAFLSLLSKLSTLNMNILIIKIHMKDVCEAIVLEMQTE